MRSVYRKEMRAYLVSPIPYVVAFIFTAFMAWWFFFLNDFFLYRQATMDRFFVILPYVFIFLVPAISMRMWSEEARAGTLETLLTMPVKSWQLVLGKFLSAWTLLFFCLLLTFPVPLTVSLLGDLDWGPVLGGYLGALLLGGALLALGVWISALTAHQIVAFLLAGILAFVLVILGFVASRVEGGLANFLEQLSVSSRYESMGRGVVDLRDILYFVCFTGFFLYLNAMAIENGRYR